MCSNIYSPKAVNVQVSDDVQCQVAESQIAGIYLGATDVNRAVTAWNDSQGFGFYVLFWWRTNFEHNINRMINQLDWISLL